MPDQSIHPALTPSSEDVEIVIDGRSVVGKKGESIINVAAREGVYIPHYCWHPSLSVAGNCRLCLVEVHLPNPRQDNKVMPLPKPAIACQTPITPGMHVFTDSELARDCQGGMMEFLLANHPLDCPICDRGGECMLQRYSMEYGKGHARMADKKRKFKKPQFDALIDIERNRCIMCTRCVRFCDEVAGDHVMGIFARGEMNYIGTFGRGPVSNILSGNVIDICPVGCLTSKPFRFRARPWELLQTQSTSIWDASGAKITHWTRNGKLYRTTPPSRKYHNTYTVNEDTEEFIDNIARFGSDYPLNDKRWDESRIRIGQTLLPSAFTEAVKTAAEGLAGVKQRHGADAIATLVSPRATMEEGYLAAKLARTVLGNDNIDWRMSFQSSEASEAATMAFEHADGDLEDGFDALVLVNGDYLHQTPVFAMRLKEHARLFDKPIVMIGHHHDAYFAPHSALRFHCAPGATPRALRLLGQAAGGDSKARKELAGLFHVNTERVEALVETIGAEYGKALIVQSLEDMNGAYLEHEVPAALSLKETLGKSWKYIPVLRDRNALGLFAAGVHPGRLPASKERTREVWGLDENAEFPLAGGTPARQLAEEIESGRIKGLLCLGADILHACPERERLLAALDKLDFFVISDLFESEITAKADVYLASASSLERDGTMCDVEGNLARLVDTEGPVGGSRPDWEALTGLANLMGASNFDYETLEDVFNEMMSLLAPRFQGSFKSLELRGPRNDLSVRDPGGARKRTREYNPGNYRTDGAHFRWSGGPVEQPEGEPEVSSASGEDELLLTWGEHIQGDDYHLNHASIADLLKEKPYAEIHPRDAERLGLEDPLKSYMAHMDFGGQTYALELRVRQGPAPGTVYMPAGLGDIQFSGLSAAQAVKLEILGAVKTAGVSE